MHKRTKNDRIYLWIREEISQPCADCRNPVRRHRFVKRLTRVERRAGKTEPEPLKPYKRCARCVAGTFNLLRRRNLASA